MVINFKLFWLVKLKNKNKKKKDNEISSKMQSNSACKNQTIITKL